MIATVDTTTYSRMRTLKTSTRRTHLHMQSRVMQRTHAGSPSPSFASFASFATRASVDDVDGVDNVDALEDLDDLDMPLADATTLPSVNNVEEDVDTREFALAMARIAWELKGEDLLLLHVAPVVYWTRYMLFVTVFSRPQLQAVLGKIEKAALEEYGSKSAGSTKSSSWELLDFGDVVVHVMTADEREYYDLESFYAAAEEVELPFDAEAQGSLDWRSKM